ncbi:MAG: hypothetical protein NTX74_08375 [Flavobacterium sp.]|nr:hypothetical protein [Flavobacterium sp.]
MNLSQEEWTSQLAADDNAVVLDVRTAEECAEGILPNALMIDIYKGQGFIYQVEKYLCLLQSRRPKCPSLFDHESIGICQYLQPNGRIYALGRRSVFALISGFFQN